MNKIALRIYIFLMILQCVILQLPEIRLYVAYYSGFLLVFGLIIMITNTGVLQFPIPENIILSYLILIVLISILRMPDKLFAIHEGSKFISAFIPFMIMSLALRKEKEYKFYLKSNVYGLIVFVILINVIIVVFWGTREIVDYNRDIVRYSGTFAGWHSFSHYCLVLIFFISIYWSVINEKKKFEKILLSFFIMVSIFLS